MLQDPSDILNIYLKESVLVGLRDDEFIKGVLLSFEHHNILVELKEEYKFIRGENIIFIGQEK